MANFDNLVAGGEFDAQREGPKMTVKPTPPPAPAAKTKGEARTELLQKKAAKLESISTSTGKPRKGFKKQHEAISAEVLALSMSLGKGAPEAPQEQAEAGATAPSGMLATLSSRDFDEEQVELGPIEPLPPQGADVMPADPGQQTLDTTSTTTTTTEGGEFQPQSLPEFDYTPPETPQEAQENPVATDKKPGGQGTIAQDTGFSADESKIDADLSDGLEELARRRGIIAVVQGLGMAASGWYGLHNNVDMSGIKFDQGVKFEAEESAILDRAKFRRRQLMEDRKESIRKGERAGDRAARADERAEDKKSRDERDTKNFAYKKARDEFESKVAAVRETNRTRWQEASLTEKKQTLTTKQAEVAAKALESGIAKTAKSYADAEKIDSKNREVAGRILDAVVKDEEATDEQKQHAVAKYISYLKMVNPEQMAELDAVEASLTDEGFIWDDYSPDKLRQELDKQITPGTLYFSKSFKKLDTADLPSEPKAPTAAKAVPRPAAVARTRSIQKNLSAVETWIQKEIKKGRPEAEVRAEAAERVAAQRK